MKILITSYVFDASAKTVTFSGYGSIDIEAVLLITNVVDGIIIYNFASPTKGGTVATNVLTLDYDTTAMSDTDELQIFYQDETAVQPVSGTITTGLDQPLTDTELRVTPVPVSATLSAETTKVIGTVNQAIVARSARIINLDSYAVAATAETLITMSYSSDNGTATTGTSYAVTSGKRLRVQSVSAGVHVLTGNTTNVNVIVRIRANNAGTAIVSSPLQFVIPLAGATSANTASLGASITIPDGWEFVAGAGIAVTIACAGFVTTTAAPKVNINIIGYEYPI